MRPEHELVTGIVRHGRLILDLMGDLDEDAFVQCFGDGIFVRTWQTPSTWFSLMVGALFLLLLWGSLFYMDLNWRPDHQDVVDPVRDRMVRPLGAGGQKH